MIIPFYGEAKKKERPISGTLGTSEGHVRVHARRRGDGGREVALLPEEVAGQPARGHDSCPAPVLLAAVPGDVGLARGLIATNGKVVGAALADAANYSRFYFQRLLRERTGETPGDCRRRLLLERAAYQLRYTKRPITDIALEANFDSLEGFSRAFRRGYGLSPSHYRRLEPFSWLLAAPIPRLVPSALEASQQLPPPPPLLL